MAELQPLLQALTDRCIPAEDLSFGRALRLFASLLDSLPLQVRHLCELPPDKEHETADQDAWKQRQGYWSTEQLNLVFAIVEAVIVQFWNISPESGVAESICALFHSILLSCAQSLKSIGCCVKLQDRSGLLYEQVCDKLLLILELALVEDKVKDQRPVSLSYSSELLQEFVMNEIAEDTLHESPSKYSVEMSLNGNPEVEEVFDDMIRLLSADLSWMKGRMFSSKKHKFEMKTMQQAAVQLSLNHVTVINVLLGACSGLLRNLDSQMLKEDNKLLCQEQMCTVTRILKILSSSFLLKSSVQCVSVEIMKQLCDLVVLLSQMLTRKFPLHSEQTDCQDCCYTMCLSSFLTFVDIVSSNKVLVQNFSIYMVASALDLFVTYELDRGKEQDQQCLPIVFDPQVVSYIFGLIKRMHFYDWNKNHGDFVRPGAATDSDFLSLKLRSHDFHLHIRRSHSEMLELIFPSDGKWLSNLLSVAHMLYMKGKEKRPASEKFLAQKKDGSETVLDSSKVPSEDEALFGDLFSESSKPLTSSTPFVHAASTDKYSCGPINTALQAVLEVLTFLKDCVFSSDCQMWIHQPALEHLSKEGLEMLLDIFLVSSNNMEGEHHTDTELISRLSKVSFEVLHSLIGKEMLTPALKEVIVMVILDEGYLGCTIPNKTLVLLAKSIISHSSSRSEEQSNVGKALWDSFLNCLSDSMQDSTWLDSPLWKGVTNLPSLFFLEVLLMSFHSCPSSMRFSILKSVRETFNVFCHNLSNMNGARLLLCSLLFSRVAMTWRYMILHFKSFPRWLMTDLKDNLTYYSLEEMPKATLEGVSLASLVATIGQSILNGSDNGSCGLLFSLFYDLNIYFQEKGSKVLEDVRVPGAGVSDACSTICCFLEGWRGKSVTLVEDLLVERYTFYMGWICVRDLGKQVERNALPYNSDDCYGAEFILRLTQSLYGCFHLGQECEKDVNKWSSFFMDTLSHIEAISAKSVLSDVHLIDNMRRASVLNVLLLFLLCGLGGSFFNIGMNSSQEQREMLRFCEQLAHYCAGNETSNQLLKLLSSLLSHFIDFFYRSLHDMLGGGPLSRTNVSSLYLLLIAGLSGCKLEDLLSRLGADCSLLSVVSKRGVDSSRHIEILRKHAGIGTLGIMDSIFITSLLHGFPFNLHAGSAMVSSCLSMIGCILETVHLILKHNLPYFVETEKHLFQNPAWQSLLSVLFSLKRGPLFESFNSKCEEILCLLVPQEDNRIKFYDLHLFKHQDLVLKTLSGNNEVRDFVQEELVMFILETFSNIQFDTVRSDEFRHFMASTEGPLSGLVDVLDGCCQESLNMKVLQFFLHAMGSESLVRDCVKSGLQEKFLSMDAVVLCSWLDQRLFGCIAPMEVSKQGVLTSSSKVRDLTVSLLCSLISSADGENFCCHILSAVLLSIEKALVTPEHGALRHHFSILIHMAGREMFLKRILKSVIALIQKFPAQSGHTEGLKEILVFLISILYPFCGQWAPTLGKSFEGRHWSHATTHPLNPSTKLKLTFLKKPCGSSKTSMEQITHTGPADSDAISVDEDEDDGTSDGEIISVDKDEDDDTTNSEKVLASRVCTFTSSGNNFMEQHWYFCYTCDLTVSKGCCSVCARVCHRGHKVVYSRLSRFFCDCGAGQSCLCLKPRKYVSSSSAVSSVGQEQLSDSDSEGEEDIWLDNERLYKVCFTKGEESVILTTLADFDVEGQILSLCERSMSSLNQIVHAIPHMENEIDLSEDKYLTVKSTFLHLKRAYKSGSFDTKIKADYANAKELKSHIVSGSLLKSLLTINSKGKLAAGEGDKVAIFDVEQVIGVPLSGTMTADKTSVKPLSRNSVRFELVHLLFNTANENYLAVAGYEDCQIFTVNARGEVIDRLPVELSLQDAYIRRIAWVPGSQVQFMVVTNKFVKIYDLSQDNISPVHYFTVLEDSIADASLFVIGQRQVILVVLSHQGFLYYHRILAGADPGACVLTDTIQIPERFQISKGMSVYFAPALHLLFLSYVDGLSLMGRLSVDGVSFVDISALFERNQDDKSDAAGLHHWKALLDSRGLYTCLSSQRSNCAVAVCIGSGDVQCQYLRAGGISGAPRIDGVVAYRPLIKDKADLLILHDDGSLHVFSCGPSDFTSSIDSLKTSALEAEQVKKLNDALLVSKAGNLTAPNFPLDFFEKTICITEKIRLGGDILRNNDSDGAKMSLSSDDGFLEGPNASSFQIRIFNPNAEIVMVGCRVLVGNSGPSHVPSEIHLFQRVVKLEEGLSRWYDVPFTNAEALLTDEEFTLTIGPTFGGFSLPRIDNLEVYGRLKDEFGWKEKLDAALDFETQASTSGSAGSGGKHKLTKNACVEEQILADCFMFLHCFYVANRTRPSGMVDSRSIGRSLKRCEPLLEMVFENDRHPFLQAAARHLLRILYPSKDAFYQAKDTLCLTGVSHICPLLSSKVGAGRYATLCVVQEFIAQMRAVCKVALHRRSNLALFLESHGSSLVEGLMQVLWELFSTEQLDADTINKLVVPYVDIIYGYAECLAVCANNAASTPGSVAPAVVLLRKLLFAPYEAVRTSCSLAISSRLLQMPFPKQATPASEDVGDFSGTTGSYQTGLATGVPDSQSILEEDGGNASVQYCCDGCSTVPIVGRRWHCNICPDFDLCEACYEIMDGDRLPPPHSRDHPMSAISIEIDNTLGGEGGDLQFTSIDELSDENLLQVATELSRQTDSSPLEVKSSDAVSIKENASTTVTEPKGVSISASKRALNSLLFKCLVDEIKGWMLSTSGIEALPLMQFFYCLASAPTSPFMEDPGCESMDLEKFVLLLLQELHLDNQLSVKSRSGFGEVLILVFTFFNLMLRNWHQPGSDQSQLKLGTEARQAPQQASSTASGLMADDGQEKERAGNQLDRACAALRQQKLLNYILSILQQLSQVFKSSRSQELSPESLATVPCGALLTAKKEFSAGNFSPYFTDTYAKAHRNDLFGDYHRLLLESSFRLAYNLVRPEKTEKSDQVNYKLSITQNMKLDGWQEVLCGYINNPHTTSIRRFARRLLLHLCGTKGHYYNVRDTWQLSREVKKLYKLVQKSGGFQGLSVYEKSVKLVKCLLSIVEVAAARPRNWQKYCSKHPDILQFLWNGIFLFGEESVVQTLKLLTLAFYAGKEFGMPSVKGDLTESTVGGGGSGGKQSSQASDSQKKKRTASEDAAEGVAEKAFLDMELAVDQLAVEDGKVLMQFINLFLLDWNAACVRIEAKAVIFGAWRHGRPSVREMILKLLLQKMPTLPSYGLNIVEYMDLLTWIVGKDVPGAGTSSQEAGVVHSCLTGDVVKVIFDTLCSQNELLANHPNSKIYNTLSSLVEFDGYYLESEPCLACSCPEVPFSKMKLDSLKSETKFTDNRILVKCVGSHTIQSVTMNVHDARRSKSVKVLNLYYNNRPVADLSELKNNWSLWKRAKSCFLAFNQTELKVEFPIPITACNFMIELDSFYENLQASSLESLQCPRCSRYVTDKHGICGNCHENAYQCRQCRNINYENLDSFLCNECGYSKYGRFEFNFMAKPSFIFENMENDEDMKKGLAAIEIESENAHKRYQQLLGFKKPLLKLVSSIGETEMDSQQKDSVQQMIVSLPGSSSFKINRKIVILGVLYGEKCKMAFDSVSRSVQTLRGLMRVLTTYLEQKRSVAAGWPTAKLLPSRPPSRCYGCANTFVGQCLECLNVIAKMPHCRQQLVSAGILAELFENNIHQGSKSSRVLARAVLCAFTEGDAIAVGVLNDLIKQKVMYCLNHHRSIDISACIKEELQLLSETCALVDEFWEARLRVVFHLLFSSIQIGARHPAIAEHIILPCLRIISQACTPPKPEVVIVDVGTATPGVKESRVDGMEKLVPMPQRTGNTHGVKPQYNSAEKEFENESKGQDIPLVSYLEWKNGATYVDFVRRQYTVSQGVKTVTHKVRRDPKRADFLALKYMLRWKRRACQLSVANELAAFESSSWVCELVLSPCSQAIRMEMCGLIEVLCSQSPSRHSRFLNLLMTLLPATRAAGESACDYFELLFKMIDSEDSRLFLTVRGFLRTLCGLITEEVSRIESQEHSFHTDVSQGYILHKFIELLDKFLQVQNIRARFMKDGLLSQVLEALLVVRSLVVQKTKLIGDCGRLLRDLLDGLLQESLENKRHFIRAYIAGLQTHLHIKSDRTLVFILELLCNIICLTKPEPVYMMVLNKAHTQEEFIRGSMTKNPYSSLEIGPLMRDVKNKICHQLDLLGLLEDDYGMELLVAGNIISLDLSVAQVYEQIWKKAQSQASRPGTSISGVTSSRECPPMTIIYRLQGLDGEATEPMIKELEDDREESQDPEVEFAIAGVMRECDGLQVVLGMVQALSGDDMKSRQEELSLLLKLLMYCCKIRDNRMSLLHLGALSVLIETARRAFAVEASESAETLLLIVESLVTEANKSDIGMAETLWSTAPEGTGGQAAHVVRMFLERLSYLSGAKKSSSYQRNNEMVARILPFLAYGEEAAMEVLVNHFDPYLHDWSAFDDLQRKLFEEPTNENMSLEAVEHKHTLNCFCKVTESIKQDSQGERLKGLILQRGITIGCVNHLKSVFQILENGGDFKATAEWAHGLELASVPMILLILRGLARGHLSTQTCLYKGGILPLFHALEGVPGESTIGVKAENLLDTLADKDDKGEGYFKEEVMKLRHATRDEMRRRALQKREELLQGLGMRQEFTSRGKRIVISVPSIEGLEDVEEEEAGVACMVCREGYSLCPTDMLGTYCYSKRVNLGVGATSSARAEWVYTTVSHFNIIHFQCHLEAKRADASLKNPKKEWEGAAIRNHETLCNNLFPLQGPSVPLAQYARCVDQYWDNLNALGRADGSRLRLLSYDIVLMLARFATGASFSTDSKGGGKESNSRLLPFMLQMACYLLDQSNTNQKRMLSKALSTYLSATSNEVSTSAFRSSSGSSPQRFGAVEETVQFTMVQSLLLESLEDWQQHRQTFLERGIHHAYMQFKHGRSTLVSTATLSARTSTEFTNVLSVEDAKQTREGSELSRDQLFGIVQPMLIYTGLVDQLQCHLKQGSKKSSGLPHGTEMPSGVEGSKSASTPALETWELIMKDRLRDTKTMLSISKNLLEWLDDMQSAEGLQEAFDIMGTLGDVLGGGFQTCEDFVLEIIDSAQDIS